MPITFDNCNTPIIIDNGTYSIKVGFAGESLPRTEVRTMYSFPKYRNGWVPDSDYPLKIPIPIGDEAWDFRDEVGFYNRKYPMKNRHIEDWIGIERIWSHIFNKILKVDPTEHPVLITEHTAIPYMNREGMVKSFFTKFNVPILSVVSSEVLALLASNCLSGFILDSGFDMTSFIPIYLGFPLMHAVEKIYIGGMDVDAIILKYFRMRGIKIFNGKSYRKNRHILKKIKHEFSSVNLNPKISKVFQKEKADLEVVINSKRIRIGKESYFGPEVLFHPEIIGKEGQSITKVIAQSINACDEELKDDLFSNIIICGGNSLFPNLKERLESELKDLISKERSFKIIAAPNRDLLTWIGGSKIVSKHHENINWIKKEEFKEKGETVVHKCFIDVSNWEGKNKFSNKLKIKSLKLK